MKLVSICIPAYQNEAGIRKLLESVEKQTYRQVDIVITDDSAGREIEDLALEFSDRLPLRYRRNIRRLGATANCNEAISMACPESSYIKLMHHDDWFTFSDSLEKMVSLLEKNERAYMAFCGTRQVLPGGENYDRYTDPADIQAFQADYKNLYTIGNTIGAPSAVLVRKTENMPIYDEHLKWLVDMEYYMAILKKNPQLACTPEPLVSIGMGEEQLTNACVNDSQLQVREYSYVYRKYELTNEVCKKKMAQILVQNNASLGQARKLDIPLGFIKQEIRKKRRKQIASYLYAIKKRIQ